MADYVGKHFEWDMEKSEEIYARRGFAFELVARMLARDRYVYVRIDERDCGEERMIAIGKARSLFITAVYTMRDGRMRIITAWESTRTEIDEYAREMGYRDESED
jgi:uncharacterized DUF497 family protein